MEDNMFMPNPNENNAPSLEAMPPPTGQSSNPNLGVGSNSVEEKEKSKEPSVSTPLDGGVNEEDANKAGVKSEFWKHFQRYKVDGEWKAKCYHCNNVLGANPKNGTKTLKNHVLFYCKRRKHMSSKQSSISDCFAKQGKVADSNSFDQEISRDDLARAIILHEYPLNMVDHIGMRRFLSRLQPSFKCPTRNTIKKDILQIYENEKLNAMNTLGKTGGRVAITTDMWTSNQRKGFMVVTGHYIDNSWKLQSRMLSFTYVPTPHTSEVLSDTLMKTLLEWNIDRRLSTITLDNCSTNDALIDNLLGRLDSGYLLLEGRLLHMRCCAHILNLIVKDGLDIVKEAIEKIRNSVVYWSATPKRLETFVSWCTKTGIPSKKKLVFDCPTRWNSTYLMLETAVLYKDVFPRLKQKDPQYKSVPSSVEWTVAKDIGDKLKVFYEVTKLFSGSQYPTANLYFDKVCEIKLSLNEWSKSPSPTIQDMATKMLLKFEKYWNDIHGIMGVAAVLDPRYKLVLLEFYYTQLYQEDYLNYIEKVKQIFYELLNEYQQKGASNLGACEPLIREDAISGDKMSAFDLFVKSKKRARGPSIRTEIDIYLDEDVLPRTSDFDLLIWWKINGVKYPTLQQIARDIFAIPVSTVASESAFSAGGRVISTHRSKLKEETIEAIMCAQNWLWALEKDIKPITLDDYVTINDDMEENEAELPEQNSISEVTGWSVNT